jgi:LPS-assembly protein
MMQRRLRSLLAAGTAVTALLTGAAPAMAQAALTDMVEAGERAIITADELSHDRALGTVTARGGVEIQYGGRILLADTVNYQVASDRVTATGSVVLTEPDGNTLFSEHIELTGQLGEGYAREVRLLLSDGSRAAANSATRTGGRITELNQAVYSACDSCPTDPEAPLIWQVKAMKVVHDQETKDIVYSDAWLEMWGVPVAYTPYLSHPDPSVKRRSGLLAPSYGGRRDLGATITTPYYHTIAPNHDVTFAPMITSREGLVLAGEHRFIGDRLSLESSGSITRDSEDRIRNHLDAEALFLIDDTWRAGADVQLASDDTYMRRYGYGQPAFLTSRGFLEGFSQRSYTSVESFYFQDLTLPGTLGTALQTGSPVVAPLAEWHLTTAPSTHGAFHTASFSAVSLHRPNGADSRRLSGEWGWHVPHTADTGEVYRLDLSMRADGYNVEGVRRPGMARTYSGTTGRVVPEMAMTWSLPMERDHAAFNEVFEPIVMGVISPRGQNPDKIPNEDSLDFEFDDTNLFSSNRFTGWDRVEGGARVNYGLKWAAYGRSFGHVETLFGQTFHATEQSVFSEASGLGGKFSDYVGRVLVRPGPNVDLLYRFRLDKDSLEPRRNELAAIVGPPTLRGSISYSGSVGQALREGGPTEREDLTVGVMSEVTRYWRAGAQASHDLSSDGGPRRIGGVVEYEDECFIFTLDGAREYTYDRDYKGGYAVSLRFSLKTLGDIRTSP